MTIFKNSEPKLYLSIDWPIYSIQTELLESEFSDFKRSRSDRWVRMFFRYFDHVSSDGYGSFEVWFDREVLSLSSEEQEKLQETLEDLFKMTSWFEHWLVLNSTQENFFGMTIEEFRDEEHLQRYIEASIACGYNLSQSELFEIFSSHIAKDEIEKITLFYRIKHPKFWVD